MPDVLDEFVIEIGLDPRKLNKGQQEALDNLRGFQETALRNAKNIEESSRKSANALGSLKAQAIELFSVYAGGKGLVEFAVGLTNADAKLGRLSRAIGVNASTINAWQGAARIFGSTAENMSGAFQQLSNVFTAWQVGGPEAPGVMQIFRAINTEAERLDKNNARIIDGTEGVSASFKKLADNLKIIHDLGPANDAAYLAGKIPGMDAGMFDLLVRGGAGAQAVLDYVKKIGVATKDDTDAFGELEKRMNQMGIKAESLGRKLLGGEGGGASTIIRFADWLNESPGEAGHDFLNWISNGQKHIGTEGPSKSAPAPSLFPSGGGAFTSQAEKEAFIRAEAAKRGIDPDQAMRVAMSEGFLPGKFTGDQGTSFGAFQLHYKNNIPGLSNAGLGDAFTRDTGKQASDPANERDTIVYALNKARQTGWGDWHGWKGSPWAGINRSGGGSSSSTTTTVSISGPITIQAGPNASAADIAQKLRELGMKRQAEANQSSVGAQ